MESYWESRFGNEGAMWKSEPANSVTMALDIFKKNQIKNILIPGFGYGRNAKLFLDNGFGVTGIEISKSAIEIANSFGINCKIHHGSVVDMPFDNQQFEGIFCYALIHLLNKNERRLFLESCHNQLKKSGLMIFTMTTKQSNMYGRGKRLSKDRYEIDKGLNVFFYDKDAVNNEFGKFGLVEVVDIEEPIKFTDGHEPLKLKFVICRKD